ncbi:MAG TPA: hypothetical protein PKA82_06700 [Pyrinomonadaceae bacterium]|nr:hypothetical protein [Pyrinomonadaceae bacterium]
MKTPTIRILFANWVEPDLAMHHIASLLGIIPFGDRQDAWADVKGLYNTNNPVSQSLYNLLEEATRSGVLEKNDEYQYRWSQDFDKNLV